MNAKMRIGHFTLTQHLRLRVKMATLKTAIASGLIALSVTQIFAAGLPSYDTNLERWAKQRLSQRIGVIRDSYSADEQLRMVTELDVQHGPFKLSAERQYDLFWLMANLQLVQEKTLGAPVVIDAERTAATPYPLRASYTGAMVLANN